jgi:hypothetical protein
LGLFGELAFVAELRVSKCLSFSFIDVAKLQMMYWV